MADHETVLTVKLCGEEIRFSRPSAKQWDRFVGQVMRGERGPGSRELAACCCVSHEPEAAGDLLKRAPAAIRKIADAIAENGGGDTCEPVEGEGGSFVVTAPDGEAFTVGAPDFDQWERIEAARRDPYAFSATARDVAGECCTPDMTAALLKYPALNGQVLEALETLAEGRA